MCNYVQLEFDFMEPVAEPPREEFGEYRVELTYGWNGAKVLHSMLVHGAFADASKAVAGFASNYPGFRAFSWVFTERGAMTVVDFGSHSYFGRITRL